MQSSLALRFTPLGTDETLENVQRKYVMDMVSKMKVRNIHSANALERPSYDVFVAGSLCVSDADESHRGPGLAFSICVQCAAIISKEPQWVDSVLVDTIMRLGALSYESLQLSQRSDLSRPEPLFLQHENLRNSLFIYSVKKIMCPKTPKALAEEKYRREAALGELSSSSDEEDSDSEKFHSSFENRFQKQYVDDHIVTASVIENEIKRMERLGASQSHSHADSTLNKNELNENAKGLNADGSTTVAQGEAKSPLVDSPQPESMLNLGSMSSLGNVLGARSSGGGGGGSSNDVNEEDEPHAAAIPVLTGVICTEYSQRHSGYRNCHHYCMAIVMVRGGAKWLAFDPMKRHRNDNEPGATSETNSASFTAFDKRKDLVQFVTRRLANMDVTEFTFSIFSRNSTGQPYDTFLTAGEKKDFEESAFAEGIDSDQRIGVGGSDLRNSISDSVRDERDDEYINLGSKDLDAKDAKNEKMQQAYLYRARQKDLLLAEDLLISRRKSVFRDALIHGVSAGSSVATEGHGKTHQTGLLQAILHWRTLYVCLIRSLWHLPAFRYHFIRGRPVPTVGSPKKCIVKAMHVLTQKFDSHLTSIFGDDIMRGDGVQWRTSGASTSQAKDPTELELSIYGQERQKDPDSESDDNGNELIHGHNLISDDENDSDGEEVDDGVKQMRKYLATIKGEEMEKRRNARAKQMKLASWRMLSPFQRRRKTAVKRFLTYMQSAELDIDLTNLHQNLDNISLSNLDPGRILSTFLQACHSAVTGTVVREDPRSRCSCYEPQHSGAVAQSIAARGAGGASLEAGSVASDSNHFEFARKAGFMLPGQTGVRVSDKASRRECLGHSTFHIDVDEVRTCRTCGATDDASQTVNSEVPHYMSFVHHVDVAQLMRVHGILSIEPKTVRNSQYTKFESRNHTNLAHKLRFHDILRGIIDRHWLRPCPRSPLCELCMCRLATTCCLSCDPKKMKDEFPEQSRKMRQEEPITDGSRLQNGSDLIDQYDRELAHRVAVSLCYQCERHMHKTTTKVGINAFQGSTMSTVDAAGNPVKCSSCHTDGIGGGNNPLSEAEGSTGMIRMYQTTGPVKTMEVISQSQTSSKKNLHLSHEVEKQLFLCERCYDMNLVPPLTNRNMFVEKLESRKFVTLLQEQLNSEFRNEEAELDRKFKVLCARKKDERARIESSWQMSEGIEDTRHESQRQESRKRATVRIVKVDDQLKAIKADYRLQKQRLLTRKTLEVNRKMSAMLRSRRDAMTLMAKHVSFPLKRAQELSSSQVPCPVNSSSKTILRTPPAVFAVALDWPESEPSTPEIELLCSMVTQSIELDRVFHTVSLRPSSVAATWSSLLLLLIRSDTVDRVRKIMHEMLAFAMTKPIPIDFPAKLAGVAYVKSNCAVGFRNPDVDKIIQGDKLAALQRRHQLDASNNAVFSTSESSGSGGLHPSSAAAAAAQNYSTLRENHSRLSVLKSRDTTNTNRSTWNFAESLLYERLMQILLKEVKSGNSSQSRSNLLYRPSSIVCRKINCEPDKVTVSRQVQARKLKAQASRQPRKTDTKMKARHGRFGESQSARTRMFRYRESEIKELQQHTSYLFDCERGQWCHMDRHGNMEFVSTELLLKHMIQNREYPVLIFYNRVRTSISKAGDSSLDVEIGSANFMSTNTKTSQQYAAMDGRVHGEMKIDTKDRAFKMHHDQYGKLNSKESNFSASKGGKSSDGSTDPLYHSNREDCTAGACSTM